jgi:3-methyladenine DNA glycosylase/8-oxoguanine DNA glycosylase
MSLGPINFYRETPMTDNINIIGLFKTRSATEEDGERILYIEASREDIDSADEIVLCRALRDSAEYFKTFGNVDLDHITQFRDIRIKNPYLFEIGKPIDVLTTEDNVTLVKVKLYRGAGESAQLANYVWSSLTEQEPPQQWYASVGGKITATKDTRAPDGREIKVITGVRWNNLALSKTPCLTTLNPSSLTPIGAFAKTALAKAMETFTETDSAAIEGYQSLIAQSLDTGTIYESIATAILDETISGSKVSIIEWLKAQGSTEDEANEIAHQFLSMLGDEPSAHSTQGASMKKSNKLAELAKAVADEIEVTEDKQDEVVSEEVVDEEVEKTDDENEVVVSEDVQVEPKVESDEVEVEKTDDEVVDEVVEDVVEEVADESESESNEEVEKTENEDEVDTEADKLDSIVASLTAISDAIASLTETLTNHINETQDTFKTISTNVNTLQKAGVGRRSVTLAPVRQEPENVLAKCLALQADKKITAADTILIDDSVKKGLGIPDRFRQFFVA